MEVNDLLSALAQLTIVVVPVIITWFIRTYVRGSTAEKDVAAIIRLSNSAIDFVENLDRRGELGNFPPEIKKGAYKLQLAGQWVEGELQRAGIKMTDEEAKKWVASEFQKRVGGLEAVPALAELTKTAVSVVQDLERRQLLDIPPDVDRAVHVVELAADWLLAQLCLKRSTLPREEALTLVRAELLNRLGTQAGVLPVKEMTSNPLTDLARGAVAFISQLKASGQLTPQPGAAGEQFESDLAVSWAMNEAAKQGLAVTRPQLAEAVSIALGRQQ